MSVLFSPEAEENFRAAVGYLVERNPDAAKALADRIFSVIDQLAAGEFEGPERTLTTGEHIRSFAVPPLRIYYKREGKALWVLRIYDQRRRPVES